jgi:predicted O-methyltransferase YrrM
VNTLSYDEFIKKFGQLNLNEYTRGLSTEIHDLRVLVTLCRYFNSKNVLELGVRYGHTANYLLNNCPGIAKYVGVDVPYTFKTTKAEQQAEVPMQVGIIASGDHRFNALSLPGGTVDLIDSSIIEKHHFDFIFIDADHSYEGVRRDTVIALNLVKTNGIIVWHDYGNEKDVTSFLDENSNSVFHVEGSMCCFRQFK